MKRHKRMEEAKRKPDHCRKQILLKTSEQEKRVGIREPRSSEEDAAELRFRSCVESMVSCAGTSGHRAGTQGSEEGY